MNITFSVDDQVAARAQEAAKKMGKGLEEVLQDYLKSLASSEMQWALFEASCLQSPGRPDGWRFNRDEACER